MERERERENLRKRERIRERVNQREREKERERGAERERVSETETEGGRKVVLVQCMRMTVTLYRPQRVGVGRHSGHRRCVGGHTHQHQ